MNEVLSAYGKIQGRQHPFNVAKSAYSSDGRTSVSSVFFSFSISRKRFS